MKRLIFILIVALLIIPVVLAETKLIETGVKVKTYFNGSKDCLVTVETSDWTKSSNCNSNQTKNYTLKLYTNVECETDAQYRNMSKVCQGISNQYQTLLPQFEYVEKYTQCNGLVHGAVDTKEVYEKLYKNSSASFNLCLSERNAYESNYKECVTQRDLKYDEAQCKEKYEKDNLWMGILVGGGIIWIYFWNQNKKKQVRGAGEEFEDEDLSY